MREQITAEQIKDAQWYLSAAFGELDKYGWRDSALDVPMRKMQEINKALNKLAAKR